MNKKITHFLLAALIAVCSLVPMFPQSTQAGTLTDSQRRILLINQRAVVFGQTIDRATLLLGQDRVLFLTSASLGIIESELQLQFSEFGLPLNSFILAQVMARSAGVPVNFVINLINLDRTFGQIALQLNTPIRLMLFRIDSFVNLFVDQADQAMGSITLTQDQLLTNLTKSVNVFETRMGIFSNMLGPQLFTTVLLNRLSFETGMSVADILALRTELNNLTLSMFSLFVLTNNTLTSSANISIGSEVVVNPDGLFLVMQSNQIPVGLFSDRLTFFIKAIGNASNF